MSPGPRTSQGASRRARIDIIDAARGTAMLLVFLSHFVEAFYYPYPSLRPQYLRVVLRIATPSFVWISGVTLAVLYERNRERFAPMRDRLIDRGLFLVLVGHILFVPAYRFMADSWAAAFRVVFITDTIGVCVIVGALLVDRIGPRGRLLLGAAVLASAWGLTVGWDPRIPSHAWRLKDFLVGDVRDRWLGYNFPVVPWLGFYLMASGAGAWFARNSDPERERFVIARAALLGGAGVAAALIVKLAFDVLGAHAPARAAALSHLAALTHKLPPSPAYLCLYGGSALLAFAGLLLARRTRLGRAFTSWVELFGRHSFAAFLLQSYVYYMAVTVLPRPPTIFLPLYFLGTLLVLRVLVSAWARVGGNRLITIGYAGRGQRRRSREWSALDPVSAGSQPAPALAPVAGERRSPL